MFESRECMYIMDLPLVCSIMEGISIGSKLWTSSPTPTKNPERLGFHAKITDSIRGQYQLYI